MKKLISFLIFCVLIAEVNGSYYPKPIPDLLASEIFLPVGNTGKLISLQELSVIKARDFEKLTGQRMPVVDKLMLKAAQKKLRSHIHKDGTLDKSFENSLITQLKSQGDSKRLPILGGGFNLGGFLLGLLLSLVGVLIAYLLKSGDKSSMIRWAWIGCAISLIIWGAILI